MTTTPVTRDADSPTACAAPTCRRRRVVHVVPVPEFARLILLHDLRRLRDETDALVVVGADEGLEEVRATGARVVVIPIGRKISPLGDIISITQLWRLLRRERPDIVHTYIPKGGLVGQIAAALAGVRHRIHSNRGLVYTPTMPRVTRSLVRGGERLTNWLAHRVLFVSRADLEFCVREGLCSDARAVHQGSGVDLHHFDAAALPADTRVTVRRELGIGPDAPIVLTVGRFVRDKGYEELVAAITTIRRDHPDVRFVWLAPVMRGETDTLPQSLSVALGESVVHLSSVRDPRPYYVAADVLVHPSHREGVSRVLMEAAAMGLPILASDIPGCREVVTDGVTATLFVAGDAASLTGALNRWLADRPAASDRAEEARSDVRRRFDQNALTQRVANIYRSLTADVSRAATFQKRT